MAVPGEAVHGRLLRVRGASVPSHGHADARFSLQEPETVQHEVVLLLRIIPADWRLDHDFAVVSKSMYSVDPVNGLID